jgi:hypothetical protein
VNKSFLIYPDGTRISRKLRIFLGVLAALLVCFIALTSIPVTSERALFVAVTSSDRWGDRVFSSRLPEHPNGDFVVHDAKLYLKVQGTRSALLLVTFVHRYEWTLAKFAKFRAEHPELEQYFPDPAKPNAGISWIPTGNA